MPSVIATLICYVFSICMDTYIILSHKHFTVSLSYCVNNRIFATNYESTPYHIIGKKESNFNLV